MNAAGIDVSSKKSTVAILRHDLKTLHRQFHLASKQKTALANNLIALQEQSFPGIRKCFDSPVRKDGTKKWVGFTYTFWHADCIRKLQPVRTRNPAYIAPEIYAAPVLHAY